MHSSRVLKNSLVLVKLSNALGTSFISLLDVDSVEATSEFNL